jgi:hypothetical protein
MREFQRLSALFGALLVALFYTTLAQAQATRTWVSGVGDDVNPCSRTAPCKTFAGAISKTAAGGEINCIDPGGFGAVTITKSITISCDYTEAGVLAAFTNGIVVNAAATDIVTLKGIDIDGAGTGINGINFLQGAALHVHKVHIRNFRGGGSGISFTPAGAADLYVTDSHITDNGSSTTTGGILIRPSGAGAVNVTVNRTQVENNSIGIRADSSAGSIRGVVRDSSVSGNTNNGITTVSGTTFSLLMVDHTSAVGNNFGLVVNGANAWLLLSNSTVTGNTTGLFVNGSGNLCSYLNNAVNGNVTSDGAFNCSIVTQ